MYIGGDIDVKWGWNFLLKQNCCAELAVTYFVSWYGAVGEAWGNIIERLCVDLEDMCIIILLVSVLAGKIFHNFIRIIFIIFKSHFFPKIFESVWDTGTSKFAPAELSWNAVFLRVLRS